MDYTTYHRIRQAHPNIPASVAYHWAQEEQQQTQLPPFAWQEDRSGKRRAKVKVEGFTVWVTIEPDYDHDWLDCRGKFTDTWEEGAIRNPESLQSNRVYKWFIPENTEESHFKSLVEMGYSHGEAREMARQYVREDLKVARDPETAGYWAAWVKASASRQGVVLGESSLGGIEIAYKDRDDSYLTTCAWDCIHEAVHEAQQSLEWLYTAEDGDEEE